MRFNAYSSAHGVSNIDLHLDSIVFFHECIPMRGFSDIHRSTVLICFDFSSSLEQIGNSDLQNNLAISALTNNWAHGVVVSHPLSMREALGSIPSVSIFYLLWYHNFAMSAMHGWQNNIT